MNPTIVNTLDEKAWRQFVDQHPQGNVFHTPEMFQVFAGTEGYQPTLWVSVDDGNHPLALLLPVQITLRDGLLRRFTTRAVAYSSVLCAPGPQGREALEILLKSYKREIGRSILFTELRNLSDLSDLQPTLDKYDFTYEEHLNFLIDLTRSKEEVWQSIRSNAKRNVRKAQKSQVVIEQVNDLAGVSAAYAVLENTYQHLQVPLADFSLFQSAFEILYPQHMLKVIVAKLDSVCVGAMTLLTYKDIVYYWYAGLLREYATCRAGDFLVWYALEWGMQNGFRVFDFGGAGKPNEEYGVRDFKAKFGGRLVSYGRNVCTHAPVAYEASKLIYQAARRFIKM